ncbi:UNVERIFIED_CONTAM: hypothetical protein PYX00_001447 [Menopon gallinae]|uniref:tRNA-splicing endonuclease subunit Sen15 domain-containing protein n=1 Tax=Menopon gallinae TaxID=328185 RepID=A0AAW2ID92_9NEOP
MMSETHPLLAQLKEICHNNKLNDGKANLTFELYLELCEVHKLWDVEHHFCDKLKCFYLTGKNERSSDYDVYVPVTTDEVFNLEYIDELQECVSPEKKSVILVFKDRDSSSTYYRVTNGLVKPDSPRTGNRKKFEEKTNAKFHRNLIKWRKNLYSKAVHDEEMSSN